jgi:hypothetical protein
MSSFATQLRTVATQLLIAAKTSAGSRVYPSRAVPVTNTEMPILLVYTPECVGQALGTAGQPRLRTVQTLVVEAKTASVDEVQCGNDLDALMDPILDALLCDVTFRGMTDAHGHLRIERIESIRTHTSVLPTTDSGDRIIGRGLHIIGLQTTVTYPQRGGVPLSQITVTEDAVDISSPTGTFTDDTDAGFDVVPTASPRTRGPDGRAESSFTIPFQPPPARR